MKSFSLIKIHLNTKFIFFFLLIFAWRLILLSKINLISVVFKSFWILKSHTISHFSMYYIAFHHLHQEESNIVLEWIHLEIIIKIKKNCDYCIYLHGNGQWVTHKVYLLDSHILNWKWYETLLNMQNLRTTPNFHIWAIVKN